MRIKDIIYITEDEEFSPEDRLTDAIKEVLTEAIKDTYNNRYVIRVTVDKVEN